MWRLNRFKQIFQHPYTSCSTVKGGNNCVWRYTCWKQSSVLSGWEHSLWPMISPFCTTDSFRQGMMSSKSLGGGGGEGGGVDDGKAVCLVNKYHTHTQRKEQCARDESRPPDPDWIAQPLRYRTSLGADDVVNTRSITMSLVFDSQQSLWWWSASEIGIPLFSCRTGDICE